MTRTAAAAALALAAAGCGGGGGDRSVEEFTADANAICAEHRATIEEAASGVLAGGQMPDPEEFGQLAMGTIIPELTQQFERLREVEPPAEVEDEFQAYVDQGEAAVGQMQENPMMLTDAANLSEVNAQADAAGLSDACHIGPG